MFIMRDAIPLASSIIPALYAGSFVHCAGYYPALSVYYPRYYLGLSPPYVRFPALYAGISVHPPIARTPSPILYFFCQKFAYMRKKYYFCSRLEQRMIVMKKIMFLLIICTCTASCLDFSRKVERADFPGKVESFVLTQYGKGDSTSTHVIDMQDVLGVKINQVYVFSEPTSNEEISEIIGIKLPHREMTWSWDSKYRIICTQDKQITYEELYEMKNVCFIGNDTIWNLTKECQELYSQYNPGMTAPTHCNYQVFCSSRMSVKKKVLSKREIDKCQPISKYWFELSAAK